MQILQQCNCALLRYQKHCIIILQSYWRCFMLFQFVATCFRCSGSAACGRTEQHWRDVALELDGVLKICHGIIAVKPSEPRKMEIENRSSFFASHELCRARMSCQFLLYKSSLTCFGPSDRATQENKPQSQSQLSLFHNILKTARIYAYAFPFTPCSL